jgi:hypothetical protein
MAKKAAVDAIISRLKAEWTQSPVLDRNTDMQPSADGSSYVRIEFPAAANRPTTLSGDHREDGGFRVVVATQIAGGIAQSAEWCEEIATIFRGQKFDDVQCWTPTIREGVDQGNYFEAYVVVPYYFPYQD